jgi:hypothetical protein
MTAIGEAAAIVRGAEDDLELAGRDAVLRRHLHVRRVGPRVRERPHPGQRSTAQPRDDGHRRPSWNSCGVVTTGTLNPSTRLTLYSARPPGRSRSPAPPSSVAHRIIMAKAPSSSEQLDHAPPGNASVARPAPSLSRRSTGSPSSPTGMDDDRPHRERARVVQRQVRHRRRRCRLLGCTGEIVATTIPACCFLRDLEPDMVFMVGL